MNLNDDALAKSLECPVCFEQFNDTTKLPKMLTTCGHCICLECLPGCTRGRRAKCPECRQKSEVPADGFRTIFRILGIISSIEDARRALTVNCSGCTKTVLPAEAFACITCSKETAKFVCGVCGIKAHRNHELVDLETIASAHETAAARKQICELRASVHYDVGILRRAVADFNASVQRVLQHCERKKNEITDASLSAPITKKVQVQASVGKAEEVAKGLAGLLASAHTAVTYNTKRMQEVIQPTPETSKKAPNGTGSKSSKKPVALTPTSVLQKTTSKAPKLRGRRFRIVRILLL